MCVCAYIHVILPTSLLLPFLLIHKLVYVYLVLFAEEQQDLALLSISTFQKGLKDPNQLIRASALRVLSSIRVPIIAPIMMLAIKEVRGCGHRSHDSPVFRLPNHVMVT